MKRSSFHQVSRVLLVCLVAFLLASTWGSVSPTFAHPEGPAHHNPLPAHATAAMRALWADQQAPQNLQSISSSATTCTNGFADSYPCNNVDLLAFLSLADIGGDRSNSAANDIWGWTDPQSGKEYAIIGRVFGTSFIDISDPVNPVYLGDLPTHGAFGSSWRDIKTYSDHAFIVSEALNHGMQVFDLTQLRNMGSPPVTFAETAHYRDMASAHNIVINEDSGFAYIVGASGRNSCSGGLHMVDIQNPTSPSFAGCFSADGYTHDAQCVIYTGPDAEHQGKEICFNSNEDTVTIVDVTNKSAPVQLSRTGYAGSRYTHQGWLTEDQSYFLLDDELDEQDFGHNTRTRVWDVSNLDNPTLIGFHDSSNPAIDHNQYVRGNFTYQANYRAGLRILDIADPANLHEVAYFDIYPADDAAAFNAAWSNYPYYSSGVVVVSGIEQGLFVLQPNLGPTDSPPGVTITNPAAGATVSGTVLVTADASDDSGVTQVEFLVDGGSIGVDNDGTDGWSASWDTISYADGSHTVTAKATDNAGQAASDSISVTVDNSSGGAFTLSATGYKDKGVHTVDLTWSGATSTDVDIYRDGALITTTANDGAHTDSTGNKGGNVLYTYQVCEAGTSTCSNTATVTF